MTVTVLHREDIKAELRKRHGSVQAFAIAHGLKAQAVADWLRGRTSQRVADAIAAEIGDTEAGESIKVDDSATNATTHRLNAGAR